MEDNTQYTRLAKRMSELGLCSRREADDYILRGMVSVNGTTISQKGHKVTASDVISLDAQGTALQDEKVTILIHKPVGFVSSQAEKGYRDAIELMTVNNLWSKDNSGISFDPGHKKHLAVAGRLDIDSKGLLVLTQNGSIAKQLIGNDTRIEKEYLVRVSGTLIDNGLALLNHGLSLDGELLRPAIVTWQNDNQLKFRLKQGKKRQIRRMCSAVGLTVLSLKRVRIGNIVLGDLPEGKWRYLKRGESF